MGTSLKNNTFYTYKFFTGIWAKSSLVTRNIGKYKGAII